MITIQVQDSLGRDIEQCSLLQPAPTQLASSTFFNINDWGSTVGQSSNMRIFITPSLAVLPDPIILLVYPTSLSLTPQAPALFDTSTVGDYIYLYITNASLSDSILSLTATCINPSSVIPLTLDSYIIFNSTNFR